MQQLSSSYGHKRTRFKTKASPTPPLSIELRAPCMAWRGERRTLEEFRPFEQKRGRRREALEAKSVHFLTPSRGLPTQKSSPFHTPPRVKESAISPLFHSVDSSPRKRPSREETLPPLCLHRKGGYRPTSKSAKKRLIRPVFPRLSAFLIHPFL